MMSGCGRISRAPWVLAKRPKSAAGRTASARADVERAENAPRPVSPELERLENLIAELETEKLILERGSVFD